MITMKNSCLRVSWADTPTDAQAWGHCSDTLWRICACVGGAELEKCWGEATEGLRCLSLKSNFYYIILGSGGLTLPAVFLPLIFQKGKDDIWLMRNSGPKLLQLCWCIFL